jgi:transcriptional regulator with XRE-family HTH domain
MKFNGSKIRELREERGYSLAELAKKAGISLSYLSEIERHTKKPSLKTIEKLANTLNISKSMLLIEENTDAAITFGQKLRIARKNKGWLLDDFSKKTGLSISYLSELERGNVMPAIDTVRKLAKVLNVPVSSLLENSVSIGYKLKKVREEQGFTQVELAEKAGISAGLIGQIENNKVQPSLQTIEKISLVLSLSPCYFVLDENIDDLLLHMGKDLRELLKDKNVQSILRMICNCSKDEIKFILNFIKIYKKHNKNEN